MANPLFQKSNNPIVNQALSLLKSKNPNGYQKVTQMMAQGINPNPMVEQILGTLAPGQKKQLQNLAKQFGVNVDNHLK